MCYHMNDNRRPYTGDHYSPNFSQRNNEERMQLWYRAMEQELNRWHEETPNAPYPKEGRVYFAKRAFPHIPSGNFPPCLVCGEETKGLTPFYINLCTDCKTPIDVPARKECVCPTHIFTRIDQCVECEAKDRSRRALLSRNKRLYAMEIADLEARIKAYLETPEEGV